MRDCGSWVLYCKCHGWTSSLISKKWLFGRRVLSKISIFKNIYMENRFWYKLSKAIFVSWRNEKNSITTHRKSWNIGVQYYKLWFIWGRRHDNNRKLSLKNLIQHFLSNMYSRIVMLCRYEDNNFIISILRSLKPRSNEDEKAWEVAVTHETLVSCSECFPSIIVSYLNWNVVGTLVKCLFSCR
jgi:hypothetical protein